MEDRPIVFTITHCEKSGMSGNYYDIKTKDIRGKEENLEGLFIVASEALLEYMSFISIRLNNKGYAVLFEVD